MMTVDGKQDSFDGFPLEMPFFSSHSYHPERQCSCGNKSPPPPASGTVEKGTERWLQYKSSYGSYGGSSQLPASTVGGSKALSTLAPSFCLFMCMWVDSCLPLYSYGGQRAA